MGQGEDEQPLVDLELLAHFDAREEERTEREVDLDEDGFARRSADDESFVRDLAQWEAA